MREAKMVTGLTNSFKEPTEHTVTITVHFTLEEMLKDKENLVSKLSDQAHEKIKGYVNIVDSNLVRT